MIEDAEKKGLITPGKVSCVKVTFTNLDSGVRFFALSILKIVSFQKLNKMLK